MPKGYLLFELLIILGLLSLLVLWFRPSNEPLMRLELERLYTVIHYMRHQALLHERSAVISFTKHGYTADKEYTLAPGLSFGVPRQVLGPPGSPMVPVKEAITWPNQKIVCTPEGSFLGAGTVYITDGSHLYALTNDVSHHMRAYRYRSSWERLF